MGRRSEKVKGSGPWHFLHGMRNTGLSLAAAVLHFGEAILHLGIGRPLGALPDPLEAAAELKRA